MREFLAIDRCDRCGAQARSAATIEGEPEELLFCRHHIREYHDALLDGGWTIESMAMIAEPLPATALTE